MDVEFEGHIIIHEFSGPRLVEVDNWRVVFTYSANGKTFVAVHPLAGPDIFWIAGTARSITPLRADRLSTG